MITNTCPRRALVACALLGSTAIASVGAAQTVSQLPPTVLVQARNPLMPQLNCSADPYAGASYTPPCVGPASSTITVTREVVTTSYPFGNYPGYPYFTNYDRDYHVDYTGDLSPSGVLVSPYGTGTFYTGSLGTVNANLSYDASETYSAYTYSYLPPVALAPGTVPPRAVRSLVGSVNSITIAARGVSTYDSVNGIDYSTDIYAIDPKAIVNNSTALTGKFQGTGSKIQFGTISGTATVKFGSGPNSYIPVDSFYNNIQGYASVALAQLEVTTVAKVTTQLDETGLLTPRIEVTEGIQMNGSRISGLAAGINPDDAVNKGQLDAAIAKVVVIDNGASNAASNASGTGAMAGGSGSQASGNGAVAFGTGNRANGNGAVAIGDPNLATGTGAVAIGADNTATGDGAVAIGNLAVANGAGNVALGNGAQATASNAVALGGGSVANRANTVSVGASGKERQVTSVAAGTAGTDAVNVDQLNTEVAARTAADLAINQRIAVEEANRAALGAALASETNSRTAADLALSNRLDVLGTRLDNLQSQVELLDKHIASSTAVAVAMSGNTFLPDMKFNLTANIGTYGGAQAGSIQIGALVSRHVAINAGVATGFNKGGKTAGRVGMTFGW